MKVKEIDRETRETRIISWSEAWKRLKGYWKSEAIAKEQVEKGQTIWTPFTLYEKENKKEG